MTCFPNSSFVFSEWTYSLTPANASWLAAYWGQPGCLRRFIELTTGNLCADYPEITVMEDWSRWSPCGVAVGRKIWWWLDRKFVVVDELLDRSFRKHYENKKNNLWEYFRTKKEMAASFQRKPPLEAKKKPDRGFCVTLRSGADASTASISRDALHGHVKNQKLSMPSGKYKWLVD